MFASDKGLSIQLLPSSESEATIHPIRQRWPLQLKHQALDRPQPMTAGHTEIPMPELRHKPFAPLVSVVLTVSLLGLLHRSLARTGVTPDLLLLSAASDFGPHEWVMVLATFTVCVLLTAKIRADLVLITQIAALVAGHFLTHFNLGSEVGEKADPRLVLSIIAGIASLHCCYLCLLAYVAISLIRGLLRRVGKEAVNGKPRPSDSTT